MLQACLRGAASGSYVIHIQTSRFIDVQSVGSILVKLFKAHTQITAFYRTKFLDIIQYLFCQVDRDGKTVSFIRTGLRSNSGIDTDQLAFGIHQRAAAVPWVNGRICLNKRFDAGTDLFALALSAHAAAAKRRFLILAAAYQAQTAALCAYDTCGNC